MNKNTKRRLFGCPTSKTLGLRRERKDAAKHRARNEQAGSVSEDKNIKMETLHNVGADGKIHSVTVFAPANPNKPVYQRVFPKGRSDE